MSGVKRYSLIWQACSKNGRLSEQFHVPDFEGFLPFFVHGDDLDRLKRRESIELGEIHLLRGILVGLKEFDDEPTMWTAPEHKPTLLYLLGVLGKGRFESPEHMILDVASELRASCGSTASLAVLQVGSEIIRDSSRIKSDLICDCWSVTARVGGDNELLEAILELIPDVDLDEVDPFAGELICYYGLCSHVFLKHDDAIPDYVARYVDPNVKDRKLKARIRALIKNPGAFSAAELEFRSDTVH